MRGRGRSVATRRRAEPLCCARMSPALRIVAFGLVVASCSTAAPAAPADAGDGVDAGDGADAGLDAAPADPCDWAITPPPASLGLAAFYTKYLDASGIPVVGSNVPSDGALRAACRIVRV